MHANVDRLDMLQQDHGWTVRFVWITASERSRDDRCVLQVSIRSICSKFKHMPRENGVGSSGMRNPTWSSAGRVGSSSLFSASVDVGTGVLSPSGIGVVTQFPGVFL